MAQSKIDTLALRAEPLVYAALRIVTGALFAFHGAQKILGWYSTFMPPAGSQLWVGGILELVAGVLLVLGLCTRIAAFIASGQMAVAYTQFHWKLAFAGGAWLPAVNKGELALVYCFLLLFIAAHGSGIFSIDARRRRA
jgi:putative oxidoreductase